MRGEIARNLSALSVNDMPRCPPGQAPEAKPLLAVGQPLPTTLSAFTCVVLPPPGPEASLTLTQGAASTAGATLGDNPNARTGSSLGAVARAGTSLNGSASQAGAALTASPPPGPQKADLTLNGGT
jgi:hypothetical protein